MAVPGRNTDGQIAYPELPALVCGPCKDEGEDIMATRFCVECNEYLCELCFKHHKRGRAYRNHRLHHVHEWPNQQLPEISNSNVNVCSKHEGESARFYCRTHRELVCGRCIIKDHKSCEDIVDIQDEYDDIGARLKRLKQEYTKQVDHTEKNIPRIEKTKDDAVDAIKKFHGEIIDIISTLESASMDDVEKLRNQDDEMIKAISDKCGSNVQDIALLSSVLGTLYDGKRTGELFMKIEENRSQMSQLETDLRKIERDNIINEYKFEPSHQLSTVLQDLDSLGTMVSGKETTKTDQQTDKVSGAIEDSEMNHSDDVGQTLDNNNVLTGGVQSKGQRSYIINKCWSVVAVVILILAVAISIYLPTYWSWSGILNNGKFEYLRSIDVKTDQDRSNSWVSGLGVVRESRLVVVDRGNNKVKLLDTKLDQITSELKLDTKPVDVSVIDEHRAAVTLPWSNSIQFITISDTLSLGQKIKTRGGCYGITYWDDKLAVTCESTTIRRESLDILDLSGNVLNSLTPEHNGQLLFGDIYYVTVSDEQDLYVSDVGRKAVYCLSVQGEVKAVYKHPDIQWPRGLTVGPGGTAYLCDVLSHSVYQLDPNSDGVQKVLGTENNVEQPRSISYSGNKLYVGTLTGNVQMFHLKCNYNTEQNGWIMTFKALMNYTMLMF